MAEYQAPTGFDGGTAPKVYGCVFCTTGKEVAVARMIEAANPTVRAIAARQEKHKSDQGKKSKVVAVLLPSYVFFEAPDDFDAVGQLSVTDVIRVLSYEGDWRLMGEDERFARWLFRYDGLLNFSKAYQEGTRIRIVSGPLKDMEGQIRRIDRRGRSGQVALEFNNKVTLVWLGFELIDPTAMRAEENE